MKKKVTFYIRVRSEKTEKKFWCCVHIALGKARSSGHFQRKVSVDVHIHAELLRFFPAIFGFLDVHCKLNQNEVWPIGDSDLVVMYS